jgi:predicted nucleotidyltransferase
MNEKTMVKSNNVPRYEEKIEPIRSLILQSVNKEILKKVYLFGSYAYGNPTEESDIDICVIIENNINRKDVFMDISLNLLKNKIIEFDLLVYREEVFYNISNLDSVENTIIKEGILLYG